MIATNRDDDNGPPSSFLIFLSFRIPFGAAAASPSYEFLSPPFFVRRQWASRKKEMGEVVADELSGQKLFEAKCGHLIGISLNGCHLALTAVAAEVVVDYQMMACE